MLKLTLDFRYREQKLIFNDRFAFIPLIATAVIALGIFILLLIAKKKKTAQVSVISLIATLIVCGISIYGAFIKVPEDTTSKTLCIFATALVVAGFLVLVYSFVLATYPSQDPELLKKQAEEEAKRAEANKELKVAELSKNDLSLLDINRDFMAKASDSYGSDEGLNKLLDYINTTVMKIIAADGGTILMVDDFDDVVAVKAFSGDYPPPYKLSADIPHKPLRISTNFKYANFSLNENIFGQIVKSGKAELITEPSKSKLVYQNGPEEFLKASAYIFVPLKVQNSVIGLMSFARKADANPFTEDNFRTAARLGEFAAASIKSVISVKEVIQHSAIQNEADIACRIQDQLHPAKLPALPGIQLGNVWNPCEGVCGDLYDIIPSRKDRISFIVSDIAGKSTSSMVVMIMLRAMLRLVVNTKQSAGTILSWANRGIAGEVFSNDHFASCALINYNPITHMLEYATGGGSAQILYYNAQSDTIRKISEKSEAIGVDKTIEYKDFEQEVQSGDIILAYTDGLVEALNSKGEQYGKEKLMKIAKENHASSGKDIAGLVKTDIKNFVGSANQHDDQTLLVIKIQ